MTLVAIRFVKDWGFKRQQSSSCLLHLDSDCWWTLGRIDPHVLNDPFSFSLSVLMAHQFLPSIAFIFPHALPLLLGRLLLMELKFDRRCPVATASLFHASFNP